MSRPDRSTGRDRDRRWLILAVIGIARLVVRRASLAAGAALLLAGLAVSASCDRGGLRVPRRLVVVTALAGAVIAVTHALIA